MKRMGILVVAVLVAVGAVACSDDSGGDKAERSTTTALAGGGSTTTTTTTTSALERPDGPAADLSEELTAGAGPFAASGSADSAPPKSYEQHEYVAAGTATAYEAKGDLGADGRWDLAPTTTAKYRTRILVRRPADPSKASGTVVIEWLNVSGGLDADAEWASIHEEVVRSGDTWVGLSAQLIGVEGGPTLVSIPAAESLSGKGLKNLDPARYGSLSHPGDGYSFDILTQVGRALRKGGTPLGGQKPQVVLAAGESQSAFALTTYANGVQPLTRAFDGFLIHSRGATGLPLVAPGKSADLSASLGGTPARFRTDLDVPVMDVQSESDLLSPLNSLPARQPDSGRFRLWEVAGTSHADTHTLGAAADLIDCGVPINDGPLHLVVKAAYHDLKAWVTDGTAPPKAPRIDVTTGADPKIERDADGIAKGGIRTPPVDVPVEVLSGVAGPDPSVICLLLGSTKPFTAAQLAERYPSRKAYEDEYAKAADDAIEEGWVLEADRAGLMAYAHPDRIG